MKINRSRILAVVAGAVSLIAWSGPSDPLKLTPESRLWVDGKSTVRDFSCKAGVMEAVAEAVGENAVAAVLAGDTAVRTVTLTVSTEKMDCGNGTMNGHMMKALKVKENPTITFRLETYLLAKGADSTAAILKGTLTLGGVTKSITLDATLKSGSNGELRVVGEHELNMKDYDLKPPSLMLGTMKVREKVNVKFDLALR
jgi:polyisoprenoid-binding protein YceI